MLFPPTHIVYCSTRRVTERHRVGILRLRQCANAVAFSSVSDQRPADCGRFLSKLSLDAVWIQEGVLTRSGTSSSSSSTAAAAPPPPAPPAPPAPAIALQVVCSGWQAH